MKLSISVPDELVEKLDEEAKRISCKRSGACTIAIREWLASQETKRILPMLQAAISSAAAGRTLTEEEQKNLEVFSALSDVVTGKK